MFAIRTRAQERLIQAGLSLVVLILVETTNGKCQVQAGVSAAFTLRSSTVSLHEPVAINFSLSNHLGEEATLDLGYDREGNFHFAIVQPNGTSISPPPPPRHEGISLHNELTLLPGDTYTQQLILTRWFPFNRAGNYRIGVTLTAVSSKKSGAPAKLAFSKDLILKVGERDVKRLKGVCANLAKNAMSSNAKTALDAARLLSYVQDIIAVPYLARLTRQGPFVVVTRTIAFYGLTRIAQADGLENVISRLGPDDRDLIPQLKGAIRLSPL